MTAGPISDVILKILSVALFLALSPVPVSARQWTETMSFSLMVINIIVFFQYVNNTTAEWE